MPKRFEEPLMIPLVVACLRLGVSWDKAWRLMLTGELRGEKVSGRWYIDPRSVDECLRRRAIRSVEVRA